MFKGFFKKYDPIQYWKLEGKTYKKNFDHNQLFKDQEKALINYLSGLKFNSVLEFGCGFGRVTKLIKTNFGDEIHNYVAFDLSEDQIKHCNVQDVKFFVSSIEDFQINEKFDLVIGIEVLMHVRPMDLKKTMLKLSSFTNKNMINLDYHGNDKLAPHNFSHDYESIYKNLGFSKIKKIEAIPRQYIFHGIT